MQHYNVFIFHLIHCPKSILQYHSFRASLVSSAAILLLLRTFFELFTWRALRSFFLFFSIINIMVLDKFSVRVLCRGQKIMGSIKGSSYFLQLYVNGFHKQTHLTKIRNFYMSNQPRKVTQFFRPATLNFCDVPLQWI